MINVGTFQIKRRFLNAIIHNRTQILFFFLISRFVLSKRRTLRVDSFKITELESLELGSLRKHTIVYTYLGKIEQVHFLHSLLLLLNFFRLWIRIQYKNSCFILSRSQFLHLTFMNLSRGSHQIRSLLFHWVIQVDWMMNVEVVYNLIWLWQCLLLIAYLNWDRSVIERRKMILLDSDLLDSLYGFHLNDTWISKFLIPFWKWILLWGILSYVLIQIITLPSKLLLRHR